MDDDLEIHQYEPGRQGHVHRFYQDIYSKHKARRLMWLIMRHGKRSWSIGTIAILTANAIIKRAPMEKLLILWNTVWAIRWYKRLAPLYDSWVQDQTQRRMDQLTGQVWIITKKTRNVLGVAIFNQCEQEGQIQVAAQESRIELALVKTAIQFARQQHVKVITQVPPEKHLTQFLLK